MNPLQKVLGDDFAQLVPTHLVEVPELMALEHAQLIVARRWALAKRRAPSVPSVSFVMDLHRRMFDGIWQWAGQMRRTDHVDGARWPTIGIELSELMSELQFWRERKLYAWDEVALRFHHRLVRIRAFEGGNGRHARLATDALAAAMGIAPFRWRVASDISAASLHIARDQYLAALRDADNGSFHSLRNFARGISSY